MTISRLIVAAFMLLFSYAGQGLLAQNWNQIGTDIDGAASDDYLGGCVSMPDANTLAIGAAQGESNNPGYVRVFERNGNDWVQVGGDLAGDTEYDEFGRSVCMPDAVTLAVGAIQYGLTGSGYVRVFARNGNEWVQKGTDLIGESEGDLSGYSVSMPDANTIAIGASHNDGTGENSGHVRVYEWDGSIWSQKGTDIDGEAIGDESGRSISMPDPTTLAIGASYNDGDTGSLSGQVRVFSWDGNSWVQKGVDIDGDVEQDQAGYSVSMPNANTLAIGARGNDTNGYDSGQVRIMEWNGVSWIQKGSQILGEAASDYSAGSISMPNENTVAIGANSNDGMESPNTGHVRIYKWNGNDWIQKGFDIDGEAEGDRSGGFVSMPDSNTVAIGAILADGVNGENAGHVRVYQWGMASSILENVQSLLLSAYPNPSTGECTIELDKTYSQVRVIIRNVLGETISMHQFKLTDQLNLSIDAPKGLYFIEVRAEDYQGTVKLVVE